MSITYCWARQLCVDRMPLSRGLCSTSWLSESKKKEWFIHPTEMKKQSWNAPSEPGIQAPDSEWRGFFHHFMPRKSYSMDIVHYLQRGIDLRPSALKKWYKIVQRDAAAADQMFKPERVATLGFDLGASHFIVHRGGKVRFKDAQDWIQQDEDGEYELARHYQPGVFVAEIDASGVNLLYEGLESMKSLKHIKSLNLAGCPHIDDWCIDRICCEFSGSLEHLDISRCMRVTDRGVAALARLRCLRTLNLHGLDDINDIKLLCLLLEDALPKLKISGIDYMNPQMQEHL